MMNKYTTHGSWDHHCSFSSLSKVETLKEMNLMTVIGNEHLTRSKVLFVTLGTAFAHSLVDSDNEIVANCHKQPMRLFSKKILSIPEIVDSLVSTAFLACRVLNPKLQVGMNMYNVCMYGNCYLLSNV